MDRLKRIFRKAWIDSMNPYSGLEQALSGFVRRVGGVRVNLTWTQLMESTREEWRRELPHT